MLRVDLLALSSITTSLGEDRRASPSHGRWLYWLGLPGAEVRSRLTLADGRVRRWNAPRLVRLVEALNDPALAKALLLRRGFASVLVDTAALLFSERARGVIRLSFNLGAQSRNELLLHRLNAEVALKPPGLASHVGFAIQETPGVRFSLEVERPLPWLTSLLLRRRLQSGLKRLHMETLRPASPTL